MTPFFAHAFHTVIDISFNSREILHIYCCFVPSSTSSVCCFQDEVDETYDLVLVGHSLGAGTAAILAILLRQEYPTLHCYAFSPPGGLLRYKKPH